VLVAGLVGLALPTRVDAAGGAFVVDDAEIAKPGDCKVESWVSSASNHDLLGVVSPACVANIGRPVELGFSVARFRSEGLIEKHGRRGNMSKWVSDLKADCPRRDAHSLNDRCDVLCPDLPKVL
jgi:hypothetical protein